MERTRERVEARRSGRACRAQAMAAPLGPGAVVVADLRVAKELTQHEPGVRRPLADAAVRHDILVRGNALAAVQLAQLLRRLERAVLVDRLAPRNVRRARNVPAPLSRLG